MITLHCTAKLLATLKVDPVPAAAPSSRLGNWYAGPIAGPRSPIVCVSERTYLPVVVERCSARDLPRALADALAALLGALDFPKELIEQERFAMAQVTWAKTASRVLLGVLNEQTRMATHILQERPKSLTWLNRELSNNIVKQQFPVDLTRQAFGLEVAPAGPRPATPAELDLRRLGLVPLELFPQGEWDPADEEWGEEADHLPAWAKEIIARGPRPAFEMERVLPGADPDDWESDPIVEAAELQKAGQHRQSVELLRGILAKDLRCLDAYAHLGNAEFEREPEMALHHYLLGARIGELSLGPSFDGVLLWGFLDNRPYLRCLHGVGLSLWRLGRNAEAAVVFRRMLALNPRDNQGARFNLERVDRDLAWTRD